MPLYSDVHFSVPDFLDSYLRLLQGEVVVRVLGRPSGDQKAERFNVNAYWTTKICIAPFLRYAPTDRASLGAPARYDTKTKWVRIGLWEEIEWETYRKQPRAEYVFDLKCFSGTHWVRVGAGMDPNRRLLGVGKIQQPSGHLGDMHWDLIDWLKEHD